MRKCQQRKSLLDVERDSHKGILTEYQKKPQWLHTPAIKQAAEYVPNFLSVLWKTSLYPSVAFSADCV
jgi:hypothetical protein